MLVFLAALMLAAAPPPPSNFIDPVGDSGTAPDIVRVAVGGGAVGKATFTVYLATPYGAGSRLYVTLGSAYRLGPDGIDAGKGGTWTPTGAPVSFTVSPDGKTVTVSAALADIGSPTTANAVVQTLDGAGGAGHEDTAVAVWSKAGGSGLSVILAHADTAHAGALWALTLSASGGDRSATASDAAVVCKGGTLPVLSQKVLVVRGGNLTGLCLFRVSKKLKGKKVTGSITVTLAGLAATKAFTAKVK